MPSGTIKLFVDDQFITVRRWPDKARRSKIISDWYRLLRLKDKYYYFQITFDEVPEKILTT